MRFVMIHYVTMYYMTTQGRILFEVKMHCVKMDHVKMPNVAMHCATMHWVKMHYATMCESETRYVKMHHATMNYV